jgi:hypothetical protein
MGENKYYFIDFPTNKKMQAIFNSYTERTFIFNTNYDYVKLGECTIGDTENWADVSFSCQNF